VHTISEITCFIYNENEIALKICDQPSGKPLMFGQITYFRRLNVFCATYNFSGAVTVENGSFLPQTAIYNIKFSVWGLGVVWKFFYSKMPKGTPLRKNCSNKLLA